MNRIIHVQYTARPEYVAKNKENIARVMSDLRAMNNPGIKYSTFLLEDGLTFMHFTIFETEELRQVLNELESFKNFSTELKAHGLDAPPKAETLSLVGSSYDFFV